MTQLFSNNASAVLITVLAPADTTLSTQPTAAFHAPVPGQFELATLRSSDANNTAVEIIKITAFDGSTTFTVERAQEGTIALAWPVGTVMEGRITAGTLSRFAQFDNGGNAKGENSVNLQPGRLDPEAVAYGVEAVAIGYDTMASSDRSMALGPYARAIGPGAMAVGDLINGIDDAIMVGKWPMVKADDNDQNVLYTNAPGTYLFSSYYDIGTPPVWSPVTVYTHGSVVSPSTPNGFQYRLVMSRDPSNPASRLSMTSGSTEPVWPDTEDSVVYEDGITTGYWVCQSVSAVYMSSPPQGSVFMPIQFGFVCHNTYAAFTTPPTFVIGVVGDLMRYAAPTAISIAGPHQFQIVTPSVNKGVLSTDQLFFGVDDLAVGGRCVGRFFAYGVFVELPTYV